MHPEVPRIERKVKAIKSSLESILIDADHQMYWEIVKEMNEIDKILGKIRDELMPFI